MQDDNGWEASAAAWIADQGEHGDFGRRYVLDPVMTPLALAPGPKRALDVGCGEGRFCRVLRAHGIETVGVDPAPALLSAARERDPDGVYVEAKGEHLPFGDESFDLVVSYLSLIDIPDHVRAIAEMARVLAPGGTLLIANLTSFCTAGDGSGDLGWARDAQGGKLSFRIDRYLEPRANWISYRGIEVLNHHRPLSAYMSALLSAGLRLAFFDEPAPVAGAPEPKAANYRRAPHFLVMAWEKA